MSKECCKVKTVDFAVTKVPLRMNVGAGLATKTVPEFASCTRR